MGVDPKNFIQYSNSPKVRNDQSSDPRSITLDSSSQYDTGFIVPEYDAYGALNEQRAARQTALDKLGNGITNMAFTAFTGAAESTAGFVYGVSSALINQDSSKLWKNGFTDNFIDPVNEWAKTNAPFYYSQKEQELFSLILIFG
jgi:hypothetical protein